MVRSNYSILQMVLWVSLRFIVFHNVSVEHCDLPGYIHTGKELWEFSTSDTGKRCADSSHPTRQMWPKPKESNRSIQLASKWQS